MKKSFAGPNNPRWKGGVGSDGLYRLIYSPGHPRAIRNKVREHILVAEKALGKFLPIGSEVHHLNKNGFENIGNNIIICQDNKYHKILELRGRAYYACGHATWRKCRFCKQWDIPENLCFYNNNGPCHKDCNTKNSKNHRMVKP